MHRGPPNTYTCSDIKMLRFTVLCNYICLWAHVFLTCTVRTHTHAQTHTHTHKDADPVELICSLALQAKALMSGCKCVSVCAYQDMCVRVMVEMNHLFGWIWVYLISPLPWCDCPTDVLVVFSTALFLVSPRLFRTGGIRSHPLWDIWRSVS